MGLESIPTESEPPNARAERSEDERMKPPAPHPDFAPEETDRLTPAERDPLASFRQALVELRNGRDPHKEIDAAAERARIAAELRRVSEAMRETRSGAGETPAVSATAEVGAGTEPPTLPELKEVKKEFEREEKKIELAEQYSDVLESLAQYDAEELQSVLETGRTKDGRQLRSKRSEELAPEIARHLADMAKHGVRRLTWGSFNQMLQLFDAVLKDLLAPLKELKRIIGLRG